MALLWTLATFTRIAISNALPRNRGGRFCVVLGKASVQFSGKPRCHRKREVWRLLYDRLPEVIDELETL